MSHIQLLDITHAANWWPEAQELLNEKGSGLLVRESADRCIKAGGSLLLGRVGGHVVGLAELAPVGDAAFEVRSLVTKGEASGRQSFVDSVMLHVHSLGGLKMTVPGEEVFDWTALPTAKEFMRENVRKLGKGEWAVIVYNDDESTMDFVVRTLMAICGHGAPLAWALMVRVHFEGSCVVALRRSKKAAEDIQALIEISAGCQRFPLKVTVERLPA
jgi:ATP-dependent Clp protease adaptor protein ClpS